MQICSPGKHFRRAHHQSSYVRKSGVPVKGSSHPDECVKNQRSYDVWSPRLRAGLPPHWEFKSEKPKVWTNEEKERVLDALSILPPDLLSTSINGIYRLSTYLENPLNPAAGHAHQIALYDRAFKSKFHLAQILGHEFAHPLFEQLSTTDRVDYAKAAEWSVILWNGLKDKEWILRRKGRVEEDCQNNVEEDFSNNLEYFLFHPKELKEKSPEVYDWISKKYGAKMKLGGSKK